MKKFFKEKQNKILIFTFFTLIFILIFLNNLYVFLISSDAIWSYGFSKYIAMGYLPYKDFNMIITPLYPFICSLFLKIIDQGIIMILCGSLISFLCFYLIYKIYNFYQIKLKNTILSITIIILISSTLFNSYSFISTYNIFLIFLILLLIYLEIKYKNKHYLIGLISSCCLLTKQSTGLIIMLITLLLPLFNKDQILKLRINELFKRFLSMIIVLSIFIFFLLSNNIVDEFIDYTTSGLSSFLNSNFSYSYFSITISAIDIIILIFITIKSYKKRNDIFTIALYSLATMSLVFPIIDSHHLKISIIPSLMLFALLFSQKFEIKIHPLGSILILIICVLPFLSNTVFKNDYVLFNESNRYKYIPINKTQKKQFLKVTTYLKEKTKSGKNVIITNPLSSYIMLNLDINQNEFNLLNKGNLGKKGPKRVIDKIKKMNNTLILINDSNNYSQKIDEIDNFVIANYKKIDKIEIFDVYEIDN